MKVSAKAKIATNVLKISKGQKLPWLHACFVTSSTKPNVRNKEAKRNIQVQTLRKWTIVNLRVISSNERCRTNYAKVLTSEIFFYIKFLLFEKKSQIEQNIISTLCSKHVQWNDEIFSLVCMVCIFVQVLYRDEVSALEGMQTRPMFSFQIWGKCRKLKLLKMILV